MLASAFAFGLVGVQSGGDHGLGSRSGRRRRRKPKRWNSPNSPRSPPSWRTLNVNDIVKSLRLNATAMPLGQRVYAANCAACHGEELGGSREQHAPNLTDVDWLFSGDDLDIGRRDQACPPTSNGRCSTASATSTRSRGDWKPTWSPTCRSSATNTTRWPTATSAS